MIYEKLYIGEENAQTSEKLCSILNINKETLKSLVRKERQQGKPICANTKKPAGYYIAPDKKNARLLQKTRTQGKRNRKNKKSLYKNN